MPQALAEGAIIAMGRGYPDQAIALSERATELARTHDDPFTRCHALAGTAKMRIRHGDYQGAADAVEEFE